MMRGAESAEAGRAAGLCKCCLAAPALLRSAATPEKARLYYDTRFSVMFVPLRSLAAKQGPSVRKVTDTAAGLR
jgi:hypothetical protein